MAFDKCTLLSSQGSDAPAFWPLDRPAGQLLYLIRLALAVKPTRRGSDVLGDSRRLLSTRGFPIVDQTTGHSLGESYEGGFVFHLRGRGRGPPLFPLGPNKKDSTWIRWVCQIELASRACRGSEIALRTTQAADRARRHPITVHRTRVTIAQAAHAGGSTRYARCCGV